MTTPLSAAKSVRSLYELFGHAPGAESRTVPPAGSGDFLRLQCVRKDIYPVRVHVCLEARAQTLSIHLGGNKICWLRNVRCNFGQFANVCLLRCAACGWYETLLQLQVAGDRLSVCPRCKAKPSWMTCPMFHTYGECGECSGEPIPECPFPLREEDAQAQAESGLVDARAHVE